MKTHGMKTHGGAVALLLALATTWACGFPAADGTGEAGHEEGAEDTLVVLYQFGDERIFGPYWDVEARFLVFQPLVTRDRAGRTVPALARSWEHDDGYRTWTFHLRPDVRWHDGVPFTAHDVKFTLELCSHPEVLYEDQWYGLDSAVVEDDSTLVLHDGRPTDALDHWNVSFPKHLLEGLDPERFFEWEFWTEPVGNGPYRHVRHEPQTMVELEANPDFYGGRPAVERILLRFGGASPLVELRSGAVDVLTWVSRPDLPTLRADDRFRIYHHLDPDVPWFRALLWNHRHPALSDRRVRRALTLALDRRTLAAALEHPRVLPVVDGFFSARQHREGDLPAALPHDPDRARSLLTAAGWRDADGDGVREREDGPLRLELLALGQDVAEKAAVLVQDAWSRVGARTQIVALESSLLRDRLRSGRFDVIVGQYYHAPQGHLRMLGPEGTLGYGDEAMSRLLRELVGTVHPPLRDSLLRGISDIVRRDVPVTLLSPQVPTYVAHRRVRGLETPYRGDPLWHAEDLRIAEAP